MNRCSRTERMVVRGSKPWDCYKSPTVYRILSSCLQECTSENVLRLRGLDQGLCFQDNSRVFHCNLSTDHTMNDPGRGVEKKPRELDIRRKIEAV